MADDTAVAVDEHLEHDFETLPSQGDVEIPTAPAGSPPSSDADPLPEWAKGGKPPSRAPAGDPAAPKPPVDPAASSAGRTLAARKQSIQEEINELTAQKHTTRREAEAAAAELAQLRAEAAALRKPAVPATQPVAEPAAPAADAQPEPLLDNFENYETYTAAWARWAKTEALREAKAARAQEREAERAEHAAAQQRQGEESMLAAHFARVETFRQAHPDYDATVAAAADLKTNPMMDTHFVHADTGPALMHYLAQHPDECSRIASLPPGPTLVALGRIEARLEAATPGPAPKAPARTHAKPPIKPVGSSPIGADGGPPDGDADLDEHAAYYNRIDQEARRSR